MKHWPTILLVEDDANDVFFFERALRRSSIAAHLQRVPDGREAMEYLKGEGQFSNRETYPMPGLLVVDRHMPRMGGVELVKWIRSQAWLQGLPVAVYSGSGHDEAVTEATESGADTFIMKGREMEDLVRLLKTTDLNWAAGHRSLRPES